MSHPIESQLLLRGARGYPPAIAAGAAPPKTLWARSGVDLGALFSREAVAVVGARAARRASCEIASAVARELVARGIVVVSGGAIGVDAAAHLGALGAAPAGAVTVAVLGSGIEKPYPARNLALFERIAERGALLSPFHPQQQPQRWTFPARNKHIAALSRAVVVVQASRRSGSLHTARAARALDRPVLAVPGSPGCDWLIGSGALRLERPAHTYDLAVAGASPAEAPERRLWSRIDERGRALLAALGDCDDGEASVTELARRSALPVVAAAAALIKLELVGAVQVLPGGRYRRLLAEGR